MGDETGKDIKAVPVSINRGESILDEDSHEWDRCNAAFKGLEKGHETCPDCSGNKGCEQCGQTGWRGSYPVGIEGSILTSDKCRVLEGDGLVLHGNKFHVVLRHPKLMIWREHRSEQWQWEDMVKGYFII